MKVRTRSLLPGIILLGTAMGSIPAHAGLTAGAGKAPIDLPVALLPIDEFTTVLDPLGVRVLVLGDGRQRAAIAVVDQTSLGASDVVAMKAVVAKATGTPADHVMIVASHTFSAPHMFVGNPNPPPGMTFNPEEAARAKVYVGNVMSALTTAAERAGSSERPATVAFGTAATSVNINRNIETADGWWLGASETGPSDKTLSLLRIDGVDHQTIATVINYAVQSSIMDHTGGAAGTKAVSADLGGATSAHVEDHLGGVSLFLTGAAGDQVPSYTALHNVYDAGGKPVSVNLGQGGYPLVALQGERLGAAAMRAAMAAQGVTHDPSITVTSDKVTLPTQDRPRQLTQIKPTRSYHYAVNGHAEAPFTILTVGDIAIVGVQVELNSETGKWIRTHSPFAHTIVATMVNGAAKYLPDSGNYKAITYQAMNSSYAPGSAEVLAQAIIKQLEVLAHKPATKARH